MNRIAAILAAAAALFTATAHAQAPGNVNIAITKLFGNITGFSAVADLQVIDKSQKEWARTPVDFAVLDGKIRIDIDMARMKSGRMPPEALAFRKQNGLDRLASIVRPDRKLIYIVYPGARSYASMTMSKEDVAAATSTLKVDKSPLGKETVDGHPCVKNRVRISDSKGAVVIDATTWNATDLQDFPVQIANRENENTTIMRFRDIKLAKPDAKQFEPPNGFKEFPSPDAIERAVAARSGPPKK